MRIDIHAHYFPAEYLDTLDRFGSDATAICRDMRAGRGPSELAARFEMMDAAGVDVQVLSSAAAPPYFVKEADVVAAARLGNDLHAEIVAAYPGRFVALAVTPLPHVAACIDEVGRALDDLAMAGVTVASSVLGRSLADPAFEPFYAELDRRGSTVLVHPAGMGAGSPLIVDHDLTWMLGAPVEDTLAVLRLFRGGIATRYRRIRFVACHLGGALPLLLPRLDRLSYGKHPTCPRDLAAPLVVSGMRPRRTDMCRRCEPPWTRLVPIGWCSAATIPTRRMSGTSVRSRSSRRRALTRRMKKRFSAATRRRSWVCPRERPQTHDVAGSRGTRILGVPRRGYKVEDEPHGLSMGHITDRTAASGAGFSYRYYEEIESTNVEAKSLARSGAPEGTVVIAEAQTAGRGRLGRRWSSPAGKGLLFSVLLRPALPMRDVHLLTLVGACAVADAIESMIDTPIGIKWPNDLFVGDRKIGGILMEVAGEQDKVDWVVVGIGINVNAEYSQLPVALRRTATSLKSANGEAVDRSELLARVLLQLDAQYAKALADGFDAAFSGFRRRDYLMGRSISVEAKGGSVLGTAAGIDEHGALVVRLSQRQIRRFHSGDVTLRLSASGTCWDRRPTIATRQGER